VDHSGRGAFARAEEALAKLPELHPQVIMMVEGS
jgi:hypothetical protein